MKKYNRIAVATSIIIPLVVAILFSVRIPGVAPLSFLPPIYASINGLTALFLLLALRAIKRGNMKRHRMWMNICIGLSICFLLMYIAYHITSDPTPYGGSGFMKYTYFFILISHIVLSVAIIPLVMFSYIRALSEKFDAHKKIARITFPIWLYVAVTGVIIYLMISPYYQY